MENKFQTSFIPKKSLEDTGSVRVKTPIGVFFLISTIIAIVTILAAGAAGGYSYYLKKRIDVVRAEVALKDQDMKDPQIKNIVRIDNKLQAASGLIKGHTAVSGIFGFLEKNTVKNLRFEGFEFAYFSPSRTTVTMKGEARSFGAVARQAETFRATSSKAYFDEPIFSDLDVDELGNVTFSFITTVDSGLVSYEHTFNDEAAVRKVVSPGAGTATAATSTASSTKQIKR